MWAVVLISSLVFIWQRRIWGRKDCEHEACHPVLCNNCSHWGEEEGGTWQNAGGSDEHVENHDGQGAQEALDFLVFLLLCFSAGDSGGSDHQCQSPAGGLWQRQDCEEWQLLSLCESLGHRRVFSGLKCPQRHVSVIISVSSYSCAILYVTLSFSLARVNSSGSTSGPQGNWLLLILKHVSNTSIETQTDKPGVSFAGIFSTRGEHWACRQCCLGANAVILHNLCVLYLPQFQTDGSAAHSGIPVSEATMAFFPGQTVGLFMGSYMLSTGLQYISVICFFFLQKDSHLLVQIEYLTFAKHALHTNWSHFHR